MIAVFGIAVIGALDGCGRKGPPVAPGEEEPDYRKDL